MAAARKPTPAAEVAAGTFAGMVVRIPYPFQRSKAGASRLPPNAASRRPDAVGASRTLGSAVAAGAADCSCQPCRAPPVGGTSRKRWRHAAALAPGQRLTPKAGRARSAPGRHCKDSRPAEQGPQRWHFRHAPISGGGGRRPLAMARRWAGYAATYSCGHVLGERVVQAAGGAFLALPLPPAVCSSYNALSSGRTGRYGHRLHSRGGRSAVWNP